MTITTLLVIEFLASFFNIFGTIMMSKSTKTNTLPLYHTFILFSISNFLFLFLFLSNGIIPLAIQMIIFMYMSINGVVKHSPYLERDKNIMYIIYPLFFIFIGIYFYYYGIVNISWNVKVIDTIASLLAVTGSYMLASHNHKIRSYGFLMFITADTTLVYVGYSHELYVFMIQAMFFVGTSLKAYYGTMKEEILIFKNKVFN